MAHSCSRERPRVNSGDRGFAQRRNGHEAGYKRLQKRDEISLRCKKTLI
jgi:hypothetical protein